ncbi:MAG: phosphonate C-P lyase system protein PhnG [Rhizobiales bacterium]|nr:phosphonate C-P lyase system protein PhnG [Hyphomicrobiales bacterium]
MDVAERRAAMKLLVAAETKELAGLLAGIGPLPTHENVRRPETGLVMVRGRIGGDGSPFNVGEATASRAAVRLAGGEIGFGYVLGRDREKAHLVALCDALLQDKSRRSTIERAVLAPLRSRLEAERELAAARTAATRVDFFTLVRGED